MKCQPFILSRAFSSARRVSELFLQIDHPHLDDESDKAQIKRAGVLGLKQLTVRVQNIVQRSKGLTYKQVAEELVKELQRQNKLQKTKQQQNIKRRVYDALNVLIAAQKLAKQGKKVVASQPVFPSNPLFSQMQSKRSQIGKKKQELKRLKDFYDKLIVLVQRNKKHPGHGLAIPELCVCTSREFELDRGAGWARLKSQDSVQIYDQLQVISLLSAR